MLEYFHEISDARIYLPFIRDLKSKTMLTFD